MVMEDPELLSLEPDSVATGNIRFQIRSGNDFIYSHRCNISLTPAFSFRTFGRAGIEKSVTGFSFHTRTNNISLSTGPVLVSHARGWIVGKATPRRSLYPGNMQLKPSTAIRKGPYTYSPFSGYAFIGLGNTSATLFLSERGVGFSLEIHRPDRAIALYQSPDQWQEAMIQICREAFLVETNISYQCNFKQWGHASGALTIKRKSSGIIFLAYTTSDRFNPLYGKNPWFGGDKSGCSGAGWGLSVRAKSGYTLKTTTIQQNRRDGYDRKTELYLSAIIGSMKSETLIRLCSEHTIREISAPPSLLTYIKSHMFTLKQSFFLPVTSWMEVQNIFLLATDFRHTVSAGLFHLTLKDNRATLKIQVSQIMGGEAELWYTRLYCGKQLIIQKAGKESFTALDITTFFPMKSVEIGIGFSTSRGDNRGVLQLQIALDSMNR